MNNLNSWCAKFVFRCVPKFQVRNLRFLPGTEFSGIAGCGIFVYAIFSCGIFGEPIYIPNIELIKTHRILLYFIQVWNQSKIQIVQKIFSGLTP